MKTCSYCGKEYPDDAVTCVVDQSPLVISKSKPPTSTRATNSAKKYRSITAESILPIAGFSVLAGLFGFGLTWLVVGFYAKAAFKTVDDQFGFAARSMPYMIAGGIIGFIAGFFVSLSVARADPKTEEEIETKYVGPSGRAKVYSGVPIFVIALIARFFEKLLDKVGATIGVYVALGICLVIMAVSLVLYDRIPPKLIVPIGIIGWMLTLSMVLWFFFFRPGAL